MSRFKILGVMIVAVFAVSLAVAAMASAVEFLLAEWLLNNVGVTTAVLTDSEGDLVLISLNGLGLGVPVEILCEGILDGFVEANGADLITELLTLAGGAIPLTALTEPALVCTNIRNCTEPLVWAINLPWETLLELMVDEGVNFFVDLLIKAGYYVECMSLKINETCEAAETATQVTNEANGTVDATFSEAFQILAGLKLGNCSLGGAETSEVNGLGIILDSGGGTLAASSE
jgi:hypothetical protein